MTSQLGAGYPACSGMFYFWATGSSVSLERADLGHEWKRGRGRSAGHCVRKCGLLPSHRASGRTRSSSSQNPVWLACFACASAGMGDGGEERCLA